MKDQENQKAEILRTGQSAKEKLFCIIKKAACANRAAFPFNFYIVQKLSRKL